MVDIALSVYNEYVGTFKDYILRVVLRAGATVLALFAIWSVANWGLGEAYDLYIPIDVYMWVNIALLIFLGYNIWGFYIMRKERNVAKKDAELYQQNLFKLQREMGKSPDKQVEQTFEDDLKIAKLGWGLWYTGAKRRADKHLNAGVIKKVLLLKPDSNSESLKQNVREGDSSMEAVLADINALTNEIAKLNKHLKAQIEVRWYEEYRPQSFTIFDTDPIKGKKGYLEPNSPNAWVVVKFLEPAVGAGHRKLDRVYKATDPERFNAYLEVFKRIWAQAKKPNLVTK